MPELPDVEGFRRVLARAAGNVVERVEVLDAGALRETDADTLRTAVSGRTLSKPHRRGKWLVAPVHEPGRRHRRDEPSLIFHFGMTGELHWATDHAEERHRHDRVVLITEAGELRYRDMRKLHGLRLTGDDDGVRDIIGDTGPDAAEISLDELRDRLGARRGQLKPALMDQSLIAGLGNLTVDEILWRARLHPKRSMGALSPGDQQDLHRHLRATLRDAIPTGRVPDFPSWLTGHRDEPGGECPRCGTMLCSARVGGRNTVWCPSCQPT